MNSVQSVAHTITTLLAADPQRRWTLAELMAELNAGRKQGVISLTLLRQSLGLLPERCVVFQGTRLVVTNRYLAPVQDDGAPSDESSVDMQAFDLSMAL